MTYPTWWESVLLALAAWRMFHLLAFDDILERPRRRLLRLNGSWKREGDATGERYRERLAAFLTCPFCLGWWVAIVWWVSWQLWPHATLVAATVFALSAGVVGAQRILSAE